MTIHQSAVTLKFQLGNPTPPAARPEGFYGVVLHDWETSVYYSTRFGTSVPRSLYDPRDKLENDEGYPEMCPLIPRMGVKLTEKFQWFWCKQLVLSAYGIDLIETPTSTLQDEFYRRLSVPQQNYIKEAWRRLTKGHTAFCNGRGTDTCWDYIRDVNRGAELPILFENTCGGHTVQFVQPAPYASGYKVKMLDQLKYNLWKDWTYKSHPQFFTFAVNSTVIRWGAYWRCDPFHFLDGKDVPVPLISFVGYSYIDRRRIQILKDTDPTPRAYYP